ncbi:MAG: aminoacyl-tRNA hydrolase [Clostridiaceae bacterium]|nr:aminoacyl-tRNA hydrolase [Clostridiaceae bacterium]
MFRRKKQTPPQTAEYLVVGLGNPGIRYETTRHNCGFMALDLLAKALGDVRIQEVKCKALIAPCEIAGHSAVLCKPQTFMNLSGQAVRDLAQAFSVPAERIIVVFDDADLAPGRMRIRTGGSAGTHNGIRDIVYQLGDDQFPRIKIGIGHPEDGQDLADYVLSPIDSATYDIIKLAPAAVIDLIEYGPAYAMQTYNKK